MCDIYRGEGYIPKNRPEVYEKCSELLLKKWDKVIIINDGRAATQSDFNDEVVRKTVEFYLRDLFITNKYKVPAGPPLPPAFPCP